MPFNSDVDGAFIKGTENFRLGQDLAYDSSYLGTTIVAPIGFVTNFANIPPFMRWYIDTDAPEIRAPSVIHDWLYKIQTYPKHKADAILREAMLSCGASRTKSFLAYLGVSLIGRYKPQV